MTAPATIPREKSNGRTATTPPPELFEIPLDRILPGPNVRAAVGDVTDLADSMKQHGVLQPVTVRLAPQPENSPGPGVFYELAIGHRRFAAAKVAGLSHIPAVVLTGPGLKLSELSTQQLVENLQRQDLNPLEEARALRTLLDGDKELTQAALAKRIGRSPALVANALALLKIDPKVQEKIADGSMSGSHAKAIARLPATQQKEISQRIVRDKLSAHDVERELQRAAEAAKQADRDRDLVTAVVPKIEEALAKQKRPKDGTQVVVGNAQVGEGLAAAGWTVIERPKNAEYLYGGKKDDCQLVYINWHPSWGKTYPPEVQPLCVDADHKRARVDAQKKANEAETRRWEEQRKERDRAEAEERKKERGSITGTAAIVAGDPARMEKIDLFGSSAGRRGAVSEWLAEELLGADTPDAMAAVETDDLWKAIDALTPAEVTIWRSRVLAGWLLSLPEDDPFRKAFTTHAAEATAAAPAKARGKKAAAGG